MPVERRLRYFVHFRFLAIGIILFSALAEPVLGAPAVFFDRDDNMLATPSLPNSQAKFNQFTATLRSFGVEEIDSINTGAPTFGFDPQLVFDATGITATTQTTTTAVQPPFAGFSIGTKALVESDALALFDPAAPQLPAANTVFSFNQHITAFGVFVIQGGDGPVNNNPTTFRLIDTDTNLFVDAPVPPLQIGPNWGSNNVFFFGVTDTVPFDRVQIIETGDASDGMLYDNIVAGFAVPEPGSLLLVMLGGAWAVGHPIRFRRRSSSSGREGATAIS
jgi:hypothetical protein